MRPLRLLLSLCSSLIAITLLLYIGFGSHSEGELRQAPAPEQKSGLKALFSFTSPGSLFPPSAIISLTDDNSTFFLARPAAFGPPLPSKGLSGPLWIGNGFGDDAMWTGELGCSDVPGWDDGGDNTGMVGLETASDAKAQAPSPPDNGRYPPRERQRRSKNIADTLAPAGDDDGTDDHLHKSLSASGTPKSHSGKAGHADIQSLQEGAEIAGKVVLLKRGGCGFLEKVLWAQRRGGVALIVGDDVRGGGLVRMYAHGDTSNVSIPALFTSHTTAHLLSSLLPTGGLVQDLSPEDVAKLNLIKSGKGGKNSMHQDKPGKKQEKAGGPTATQSSLKTAQPSKAGKATEVKQQPDRSEVGWFRSFLSALGLGSSARTTTKGDNRRPPSSGTLDWVLVEHWDEEQKPAKTGLASAKPTSSRAPEDFVIGEQDWRDPDLVPKATSTSIKSNQSPTPDSGLKGGSIRPSSGEYTEGDTGESRGWINYLLGGRRDDAPQAGSGPTLGSDTPSSRNAHSKDDDETPEEPEPHEGLWVTLTPTNMSTSPFFDTLLVLVVSPLVTLTVVYALLLLRSRIRRRRWRAPKSLVERLPVRTYHTISDSSPSATPGASSPTTPLLQHTPPRPTSSLSRPQSRTESEVPATSSSFHQAHRRTEEEKRESGLAEWRRRYGGRQKECVVCLEEYVDGISRVMSLPCGHEFHADCM